MIDGLKLTMTGRQLRSHIEERIRRYQSEIDHMSMQLRMPNRSLEEGDPPDSVLEGEISRAERRIGVLAFICDYIVAEEVYRLGEFDLRFADLLPDEDWDCDDFGIGPVAPPLRT